MGFLPLLAGVFTGSSALAASATTVAFLGFLPLFAWGLALASGLKQRNQSRHLMPSSLVSTRSFAVPQDPGAGMMTSSPGFQLAGVAQFWASAV